MTAVALVGAPQLLDALAEELRRHGHELAVVARTADELPVAMLADIGLVVAVAQPSSLDEALLESCDRSGVPIVALAASDADRRHALAVGVLEIAEADRGWAGIEQLVALGAIRPSLGRTGRVVAVWGPAGAPGRTTVAVAVAAELAAQGRSVALVDADTLGAAVAPTLGMLDEAPGFAAACRLAAADALDHAELDRVAQHVRARRGGFRVLTGIARPSRWPELSGDRVEAVLRACRTWVDDVVVDTGFCLEQDEEISSDLMGSLNDAIDGSGLTSHNQGQKARKPLMRVKIGAYARISLDAAGHELGVARQHADITALAERRGWEITHIYTDNNVSAFQPNVIRPEFERMLDDLRSGEIMGVVAYDLDRLWRKPTDLERIIDIYQTVPGLQFATIQADYNLSTSDGRLSARVLAASASKQSEDTARRVKRKIREQAEAGKPHWSKRPFGFNRDGSLDPAEAPIVREMGEMLLKGYSYREIAWRLNEAGKMTRAGSQWGVGTIRKMMIAERYAAIRIHDGVEYAGSWTPIFSRDEWAAMQQMVRSRKESYKGVPNNRRYLLTGLLVCKCGTHLRGMTKRDGWSKGKKPDQPRPLRRTYQCPTTSETERRLNSCASLCVGSDPLEHFIREVICTRLETTDLAELIGSAGDDEFRATGLLAERDQLTARRNGLIDDYTDGTLTKPDFLRARGRVNQRITNIDQEIDKIRQARITVSFEPGQTVRDAWTANSDGWRRELIETLIESIHIGKSSRQTFYLFDGRRTRFDAGRVTINWKV